MTRQMHLTGFYIHSPINHTIASWADPADQRLEGMKGFSHWQDLARTLERGRFDGVFFADTPGGFDRYKDNMDAAMRYGVCWPSHDPMALVPVMAAVTEHLGFGVTLSLSGIPPYLAVRTFSTLDYLTGGRVGWNVVTGHLRGEHRALGLDQLEHDERYDRAEEYMEICYRLWDGFPPDAVVADKSTGILVDPAKMKVVNYEGRYLKCHAAPPAFPSPQGRPVLFQAGTSGRGQRFAVSHADVIFSIQPQIPGMHAFMKQVRETASAAGKNPDVKVTFGIQPIIGGTEAEAQRLREELLARVPIEGALARASGTLGIDFSKFNIDEPIEHIETQASQGLMSAITALFGDRRLTFREAALKWGCAAGMLQIVGTPEQVADQMETIFRETGCHGFNVTPTTNIGSINTFVDEVVPILQRRGVQRTEYEGRTFRDNLAGRTATSVDAARELAHT